jgi:hypothetical protein
VIFRNYSYQKLSDLQNKIHLIETQMIQLQKEYEYTSKEVHSIVTLLPMLDQWDLKLENCDNWISICRNLGLVNQKENGHRLIKKKDKTLHILIHKTLFSNYCTIDKVTYSE